ncbi:hypothetical protein DFO67_10720 [Modicisalibacter xianhensis]|uniref:Uncharacterized protein n=1 Tax=Modicisalibacter xianhensis TaxID=442341 RepID=A0A4R8FSF2_9GAMM|nr:hypothetical protein DFO67_10720 [Halomonas xianhensis]
MNKAGQKGRLKRPLTLLCEGRSGKFVKPNSHALLIYDMALTRSATRTSPNRVAFTLSE